MTLCISGTRRANIQQKSVIINSISQYISDLNNNGYLVNMIILGGCRGVDKLVENYCNDINYPIKIIEADWNKYGKSAGPIRNREMLEISNYLIAFPDSESQGTRNTINIANKMGIMTRVIEL